MSERDDKIKEVFLMMLREVKSIYGPEILNNLVIELSYEEEPNYSIMLKFKENV